MKKPIYASLVLASALAAAGCQTTPPKVEALESANQAYNAASSDPRVNKYAAVELGRAREALILADSEWRDSGDSVATNHLAYLARQRATIATEVATQRDADEQIKMAGAQRNQAQLQARTVEADSAKREAQSANQRAAQLEGALLAMEATKGDRGLVLTLQDVVFDTGSAILKPGALRTMDRLAELLRGNPERRVQIEGFTDSQGSDSYNLELAERRASAVRTALIARGVPSDRVVIQAYGEAFPVASNDNAAGRQLNRRVEIVFSDEQGRVATRSGMSGAVGSQPR
ncbi:MAG TPA: OmpA family protein [Burkholderiales bacterium]|jgi:outer membrane protein OmpA-like peptidoglycan-associated protein|nr:OmpA family protein [Burkholderiales bacterium]